MTIPRARQEHSRRIAATALAAVLLAAAGCTSHHTTTARTASTAAATPSSSTASADDPGGREACRALGRAQRTEKLGDPGVMRDVAILARSSTTAAVQTAGGVIALRVDLASRAAGAPDEATMRAGLASSGDQLGTACARAGYPTVS